MRKLLAFTLAFLMLPVEAFATFGAATAWDVRTTGADTNGGGFDGGVGSPGTDESQGSGTAISITLTGTTTGTGSPSFSSTTHGPGNYVNIASGSGCSTGWYEVVSQTAGVATFDHAMGSTTNVCVGVIGGSLLTISQAITNSAAINNMTIWVKTGTYTVTSTITYSPTDYTRGYTSTHGDQNGKSCSVVSCPLITTATNSTNLITLGSNQIYFFYNLSLSNTASTRAIGVKTGSFNQQLYMDQVVLDGFSQHMDLVTGGQAIKVVLHAIEAKNSTTGASGKPLFALNTLLCITDSYIHDNVTTGAAYTFDNSSGTAVTATNNIFYNNTTTGIFNSANNSGTIANNDIVSNTLNAGVAIVTNQAVVENNILYNNTGSAISTITVPWLVMNNAFGSNTADGTTGIGAITGISDPFVAKGSGNFALNTTAGAGALLRGAGFPGTFPGGLSTGYPDIGAVQAQASSGSGSTVQTTVQN